MTILNKIKAILNIAGQKLVLSLRAAEIKKGVIFLHPEEDPDTTYIIKNSTVDILINDGEEINANDIMVRKREPQDVTDEDSNGDNLTPDSTNISPSNRTPNKFPQNSTVRKKAKITFTVYEDERDLINNMIKSSGYNRSDYLVACFHNNKKKTVSKSFIYECEKVQKIRAKANQNQPTF